MQEINRAATLLGPKTQECNTRDKQEHGAACLLDQIIRLLPSQTAELFRWSCGVAREAHYLPLGSHTSGGPIAENFLYSPEVVDFNRAGRLTAAAAAPETNLPRTDDLGRNTLRDKVC